MNALGPILIAGVVVTAALVRAAVTGRGDLPPARTKARWAGATLSGLLTVGAAGIALMRSVA